MHHRTHLQRRKLRAVSHSWMPAEARKREYKRLWQRVKRKMRNVHSNTGGPTVLDSEAQNPRDIMPVLDSGLQNAVTGEFVNTGFNADNVDTLLQHTMPVETENLDIQSSTSDTDVVFFEQTANITVNLSEELKKWIIGYNIKHNAADALLKILRDQGHTHLPSTAKTLLKTDPVESQIVSGVECVTFGVTKQLIMCLNRYPYNYARDITEVEISLSVDGLPLFKSTGKSFWPVLCTVHLKPASTFPLAIALTEAKPKSLDFIKVIADELNMILRNGFSWGETTVNVSLRCITCDAPAKAMLKCIKQFSGYFGCDKCTQKGNWEGRMTYQQVHDLILRDDVSFREQHQPEHHQEDTVSPFSNLQIDMVKSFPADYMHQCCLGVMRKMLLLWSRGKLGYRLSPAQLREVNQRLRNLRCDMPHIFARKPRSLDELERWKATEFRQFMLYTGKVVLWGVLPETLYGHFMAFSVAMCILVSPHLTRIYNTYAHELLTYFVEQGRHIYGQEFLVYNVHSLLHLTADATTYGSLDKCSAFAFESYLHQLKKMVRSGNHVLIQAAKRLQERSQIPIETCEERPIQMKHPNNVYIVSPTSCCEVLERTNSGKLLCRVFSPLASYLCEPCDSRIYGAFVGFYIVVFTEENSIAVAPASWVEEVNGILICYWPRRNANAMAKACHRPDKELWKRYKIRILSETDNYKTARERAKKAVETSNVESEDEVGKIRKKKIPARYWTDSEGENEIPPKQRKKASMSSQNPPPTLPKPPSYKPPTDITVTAHASEEDVPSLSNLSANNHFHDLKQLIEQSEQRVLLAIERMQSDVTNSIERLVQAIQQNCPGPASIATPPQETFEGPCKTLQELQELILKLEGTEEKNRMIQYLSLLGGSSIGDAVRRILRKVATNEAWSNYSLKGRKGKLPFMGTSLHYIVLSACAKQFPKITEKEMDACIGETLKHAPHRARAITPRNDLVYTQLTVSKETKTWYTAEIL
ncbi:hypothetical protein QQF64_026260 [Cirrhinus molitorella]|uniref:Transposase domain-containing protein n=1 Tax=Cirrhinus molitorella TaxID=172907 RepID=A0ABR3NRC2_9TELE